MRPPFPVARALALALLVALLAGCVGGAGDGGDVGGGGGAPDNGPGAPAGEGTRSPVPSTNDPQQRFAVLVVEGQLTGEGPEEDGPKVACSLAAPNGAIDVEDATLWAQPGTHTFQAGKTWVVVVDRVAVDDPRGGSNGCRVPALATPSTGEALWAPQMASHPFHLRVYADGDDLLVGKNAMAPQGTFRTQVTFEDGQYMFSGDLAFTHAGWWPNAAFGEREEEAPTDGTAVWWG